MKIHPIRHPEDPYSQRHYRNFLHAASLDEAGSHELVNEPGEADAYLFFEPGGDPTASWLRGHELVRRFPGKCFSYSENDHPFCFLPGIYVSAGRVPFLSGRIRTYAYISYGPSEPLRNPFIDTPADPDGKRSYLFSFIGRITHRCRKELIERKFNREDILIEVPDYNHWGPRTIEAEALQRRYAEVARSSLFALCPRGDGPNSIRLYEMMQLGVAPVILSDDWVPPRGPDWDKCSVRVPENRIPELPEILSSLRPQAREIGQRARREWETWFASERQLQQIGDALNGILSDRVLPERLARLLWMAALGRHGLRYAKVQLAVWLHRSGLRRIG